MFRDDHLGVEPEEGTASAVGHLLPSSNGGTNSACMYHAGSTYGKALSTEVEISRCESGYDESDTFCYTDKTSRTDSGTFKYYAGPVGVTGTKSRCVVAWGTIISGSRLIRIDSNPEGC